MRSGKDTVYNTVANLRQKRGVTQKEFADSVGVTRQTIIAIEKGNYAPSVALALVIAEYFKVAVEDVFSI